MHKEINVYIAGEGCLTFKDEDYNKVVLNEFGVCIYEEKTNELVKARLIPWHRITEIYDTQEKSK